MYEKPTYTAVKIDT